MAVIYLRCGSGVSSFKIHSYTSTDYPQTITTTSLNGIRCANFAVGSTDAYIDTVSTTQSGTVVVRSWSDYETYQAGHTGYESELELSGDKYIRTYSNINRYIEVAIKTIYHSYYLHYNANGGSGAPAQQTMVTSATSYTFDVSNDEPTRNGYTFLGWSYVSDATEPSVMPGGRVTCTTSDPSRTLYAVWRENITPFYWFGNEPTDANNIQTGKQRVMTATMWDNFADRVDLLASICGVSVSISRPSSGSAMTHAQYNSAVSALSTIKATKTAFRNVTLPSSLSSGDSIAASQFQGTGSIKGALNAMINLL